MRVGGKDAVDFGRGFGAEHEVAARDFRAVARHLPLKGKALRSRGGGWGAAIAMRVKM